MKKWFIPLALIFLLSACGNTEDIEDTLEPNSSDTEVSAPEGELDPTEPEEVDEADPKNFSALVNGEVPAGEPVIVSGTVEELTDDAAFPAFILSGSGHEIFIRNMAETFVEAGDTVKVEGIYDGDAEEEMPLISASRITVEE